MPRKEPIKLNEFLYLVPERQQVRLIFDGLFVTGTQEAVSFVANSDINGRDVTRVNAADDCLEVWVRDEND